MNIHILELFRFAPDLTCTIPPVIIQADRATQIALTCGGAAYDPFSQEEDGLGVTILKNMSKQLDYSFIDNRNQLSITL